MNPGDSNLQGIVCKINKLVFFTINGTVSLSTSAEGHLRGLPYTPNSNYLGNYWVSGVECGVATVANGKNVFFRRGNTVVITYKEMANKAIFASGCYMTNQ